jgi:hypothetical protein
MADCFSPGFVPDDPAEKVPMHPEDFVALLAWVRAKEGLKNSISPT